jgi:hypothetical protein
MQTTCQWQACGAPACGAPTVAEYQVKHTTNSRNSFNGCKYAFCKAHADLVNKGPVSGWIYTPVQPQAIPVPQMISAKAESEAQAKAVPKAQKPFNPDVDCGCGALACGYTLSNVGHSSRCNYKRLPEVSGFHRLAK